MRRPFLWCRRRTADRDEAALIGSLLEKKHFRPEKADYSERRKMQAFLFRKGFSAEGIRKAMNGCFDDI